MMAEGHSMVVPTTSEALAFARYVACVNDGSAFPEESPMVVQVDASLPGLYKETHLLAIRKVGESKRSEFLILRADGDIIVAQEVVARHFLLQQQLANLPLSSIAITPANYRFHYKGEVGTGPSLAYVYQITPKAKRDGLIEGQLWIDPESGSAVLEAGRYVKRAYSFAGNIEIVRDIHLIDGQPRMRTTHLTIDTATAGHGELTITERPLTAIDETPKSSEQE